MRQPFISTIFLTFFLLALVILPSSLPQAGSTATLKLPYQDPELPADQRVADLLSRMTLEEKLSQMTSGSTAIKRLGVPQYDWWNEALHGVARAGYATVFPQAIGLAATFSPNLMYKVADVISTEARAKNNEFIRNGDRGRYKGLTFWSPNINIFRDPRWGRGQETYGEDPYLAAKMAVAFVKGLQGEDPHYLKTIATPKHYAVHSGPEPDRHSFDARVSERDLRETYLPAFRAAVIEGHAGSVMCAYNRVNGEPCCSNSRLLTDILRNEWRFDGYVVSDCGAVGDIYDGHHLAISATQAAVFALKAGTDLNCGAEYPLLAQAVKDGSISQSQIDMSVSRLLLARFRLGMFDPPAMVPYNAILYSENDSLAHRELALRAAHESIVLLKNNNHILPLKKEIKTLALIGPNADASEVLLGNYNGQPSRSVTPLEGIRNKVSVETKLLYAPGVYVSGVTVEPVPASALRHKGSAPGLEGEYFNNRELSTDPVFRREDGQINFDWGEFSPAPSVNKDGFSVRWTGQLIPSESGTYKLGFRGNGGVRLYVDGNLLVQDFTSPRGITKTVTGDISLQAGHPVNVRLEYIEKSNTFAAARLVWTPPNVAQKLRDDALSKARQADLIVMVMGISPTVEGEERPLNIEGFSGGDRTDLTLPSIQEDLIREITALGKPVVLVLMGGSALAVNWADKNVSAILDAWYPGEEGGTAIADVLFGDYNPAGRLPVTFYKSIDQLPPFADYNMQGRTYRYFNGEPLYPFGFGLSFTKFKYSNLQFSQRQIRPNADIEVSAEVENIGQSAGDEVVQLYLTDASASVPAPLRSLQGFARIHLEPKEKEQVSFSLSPRQLSLINDRGDRIVEPGQFLVSIGGRQPGISSKTTAQTSGVVVGYFAVIGNVTELKER